MIQAVQKTRIEFQLLKQMCTPASLAFAIGITLRPKVGKARCMKVHSQESNAFTSQSTQVAGRHNWLLAFSATLLTTCQRPLSSRIPAKTTQVRLIVYFFKLNALETPLSMPLLSTS